METGLNCTDGRLSLSLGFTKHISLTTPASLSEEAADDQDTSLLGSAAAAAAAAAGLRRSFTTDDAIMTSQRAQPISASV